MNWKAIIFDLDGVIVSTDEFHYLAWKEMADGENIDFDRQINNRLRGVSRMQSLEIILERAQKTYSQDEKAALAERKNEIYKKLLSSLTPKDRLKGVGETLERLRGAGIKLAIGSSSKNTPYILEKIGYGGYFDAVADGNDITHSKPNSEVFLKAAEKLGLPPQECAVVEDAESGIQAAKAGGFYAIAISDAVKSPLKDIGISAFSDILTL